MDPGCRTTHIHAANVNISPGSEIKLRSHTNISSKPDNFSSFFRFFFCCLKSEPARLGPHFCNTTSAFHVGAADWERDGPSVGAAHVWRTVGNQEGPRKVKSSQAVNGETT